MAERLNRIDRFVSRIEITDDPTRLDAEQVPGVSPAIARDPEGYLLVDGFIARDGLLEYSDGKDSWIEYRPRAELVAAADSWAHTPVTDDHPESMVDADTWREVARGVHISRPVVTEPNADGVSYLHARLLIADRDLIKRIRDGAQAELSIGFTSEVVPTADGVAPDGTRADAIQTKMLGNHTAAVARGRAGSAVRVLLDSAAHTAYNGDEPMRTPKPKNDEAGAPTDMVEIIAPDGSAVMVPTWVAAMLQELEALKGQAAEQVAADPNAAAPTDAGASQATPPPAPAQAQVQAAAPVAPTPAQAVAPAPPASPEDEESRDAVGERVRKRARLERLAFKLGIAEEKIDAADDRALALEIVAKRLPHVPRVDSMSDEQLSALVEVAAATPKTDAAPPPARGPWGAQPQPIVRDEHNDAEDTALSPMVEHLASQGYL